MPIYHIIGFGSIGRGVIPLLYSMLGVGLKQIHVYDKSEEAVSAARDAGLSAVCIEITKKNFAGYLHRNAKVERGDVVLNLAVDVGSKDLMRWCQHRGAFYLDTCVEPWAGGYRPARRVPVTNAELREDILTQPEDQKLETTALIAHGANPGLITYFVRAAIEELAHNFWLDYKSEDCGVTAWKLGVKVIQIAENDTQFENGARKVNSFHNTWSVPGFISELRQPVEAGVGTHEDIKALRKIGRLRTRMGAEQFVRVEEGVAVPCYQQKVRSWTPDKGEGTAYLVTHHEALSVNAHVRVIRDGVTVYAPTVFYAYQPCLSAVESIQTLTMENYLRPVLMQPVHGHDQLGALLIYEGPYGRGSFWYGSTVEVNDAARWNQGPTTLQVTTTICAGIKYMLANPKRGVLEAENLPWREMLDTIRPFLGGKVSGHHTQWCPPSLQLQDFFIN